MTAVFLEERVAADDGVVAEIAGHFDLRRPDRWTDLGGSWTTNLKLDFRDRSPLVVRIHGAYTDPDRLAAVQAARIAVADAGLPAVRPLRTPSGHSFVRLGNGRLVELEPFVDWNERMNTAPRLEAGFGVLSRLHDALRTASIPAGGETATAANHIHSEHALEASRRGADRIRGWRDPVLTGLADRAVRHLEAVAEAEEPLLDRQLTQLVHGDFWDNNVVFRDGELAAVLDFDFMAARPRIDDLALTIYFFLLEPGRALPTAEDRGQVRRFLDAYDAATPTKLTAEERAMLPLAIARQPAWSLGRWALVLDDHDARQHVNHVVGELPVAQAVLAELPAWQDALLG
ncbi:phosphotransferase enzyme family protein [Microlunatus parietis]|uniref:Homoserine kinase type II n=1 Tax=Microlunatus parietis TaxID=682979 RepID=A0A7Y9I3G1_9ACTN|nr:phosphotransferase [Microlunatus parietis]NYE69536.1 homoserine kinase type II [Microlunatus parietis]